MVMMAATQPLATWAIRNIGPPEIFALVTGLAVASSVGGRTIWKGWLSVLLGLLIATIGQDPVGGINRFNFGFAIWQPALHLFPQFGFFAVSEIFGATEKARDRHIQCAELGMSFPTLFELWSQKIAVLRSILVDFFVAFSAGIGTTLAAFWLWEAVRWSKDKESFEKH